MFFLTKSDNHHRNYDRIILNNHIFLFTLFYRTTRPRLFDWNT